MADTAIKKWNGTSWEVVHPETTHTQIVASGTPDSSTFLRGDGVWSAPDLSGLATETYVDTAVSNLVDTAPATLDTLNELAQALGDDPNFATTVTNSIAGKVAKTGDTMTGDLLISQSQASDPYFIKLHNTSNASSVGIEFKDDAGGVQSGYLTFQHSDGASPTGGFGTTFKFNDNSGYGPAVQIVDPDGAFYVGTNKVFHDGYHPNADKLTTARNIALTGDVTGNANFDGSGNISITATVADDSHTHDGRYYTESEADSRFVNVTGDTMSGNLRIDSGSFASLILDRTTTGSGSIVQFENNNGVIGGIGAFGDDGLQFRTTDGTQMVIDASNNVGIGTTSPDQKLEVAGNAHLDYSLIGRGIRSSNRGEFFLNSTGATDVSEIFFGYGDGYTENNIRWGISDRGTTGGALNFYRGPANGGFSAVMSITDTLRVGINTTSPAYPLDVNGDISGNRYYDRNNTAYYLDAASTSVLNAVNYNVLDGPTTQTRDKIRVWNGGTYTIGMKSGYTYGGLNNDYAMSFQMNDDSNRGFWWGDNAHTDAQGAMSLTTNGRLTVAGGARIGFGESTTATPSASGLDVSGNVTSNGQKLAWVRTQGTTNQSGVNFTLTGTTLFISTTL